MLSPTSWNIFFSAVKVTVLCLTLWSTWTCSLYELCFKYKPAYWTVKTRNHQQQGVKSSELSRWDQRLIKNTDMNPLELCFCNTVPRRSKKVFSSFWMVVWASVTPYYHRSYPQCPALKTHNTPDDYVRPLADVAWTLQQTTTMFGDTKRSPVGGGFPAA